MPRKKTKRGKPDSKKSEDLRHRLDKALEEGLEETFPASDAGCSHRTGSSASRG